MTRAAATTAVAVVAVLVAGCGARGPGQADGGLVPAGTAPSGGAVTHVVPDAVASPVRTPGEVAARLRDQALVPARAVPSHRAPTASLQQPPELPATGDAVVRTAWWRVDEPAAATYRWVQQRQSRWLEPTGSSSGSGPTLADQSQTADFDPRQALPATVNSAQLSIEVVPVSAGSSAIGAYAVVVPQPPRPPAEDVPGTVRTVSVETERNASPTLGPLRRHVTQTGAAARRTVHDFDSLVVMPAGEVFSCPALVETTTLVFQSPGRTWRAVVSDCGGVAVTLDGRVLPALQGSDALGRDTRIGAGRWTSPPAPGGVPIVAAPSLVPGRPIAVPTVQTAPR